jgi:hypothetical protein
MVKWLAVMAAMTVLAGTVLAAEDADKSPRVRGVIKEVKADEGKTDSGTIVVTVKKGDKDEDMSFVVPADASIKNGDTVVKFGDLKVKDKVRVDYKEADGKKVVTKLRVENEA